MEQAAELLRELAAELGVAVEYLWPLLVKQQMFWAVEGMVLGTVMLIVGSVGVKYFLAKHKASEHFDKTGEEVGGTLSGLLAIVGFAMLIAWADNLFIPEVYAIQSLLP